MIKQSCLNHGYSTAPTITQQKPVIASQVDSMIQPTLYLPEGEGRKGEGGMRTKNYFKHSESDKPLITVVTVVYNGGQNLEETILSVICQKYENIEYIIIDGGSIDETVEIIKKYEDQIDYWISEKDHGLYDAMNKGLSLASGEWINFMNCGDSFYDNETIGKIFSCHLPEGVIYGDVMFSFDGSNAVYVEAKKLYHFWKGMQFVHQASFVSSKLMRKFPFDTSYRLIADYNSLYQIYLSKAAFTYINVAICNFQAGGLSDNNPKSIYECQEMIFKIHGELHVRLYYYYRYLECFIKYNMARWIGQANYAQLRVVKYKLLSLLGR